MMDIVGPDQKRPRLSGPPPGQWQSSTESSRQLPIPATGPYHTSPFSRPEPQYPIDRRPSGHSDHPQYEHQRPNSGPTHGYHPPPPPPPPFGAPQREPTMVKRDPSDEPPSHYRPSSTGTPTEKGVNTPILHDAPRVGGYPLPPFAHHEQQHPSYRPAPASFPPPQSPMTATEPYSHQHFAGPPPTPRDVPYSVSYPAASTAQSAKRPKAQRAAQACDSCRTLKGKCDEGRPGCSSCREKGIECRYRDPPPKQQDKAQGEIIDTLSRIETYILGMQKEMLEMQKVQANILSRQSNGESQAPLKRENQESAPNLVDTNIYMRRPESDPQVLMSESPHTSTPGNFQHRDSSSQLQQRDGPSIMHLLDAENPPLSPRADEEEEEEGGDPGPPKAPSIPVNHTTGAARLLLVPSIKELCRGIIETTRIKNEKYPIIQEEKRGLLRLYGRGEGIDAPPGYDRDPLIDHGSDHSNAGDTSSDVSSPAGEEWGQIGGLTPPGNPPPEFHRGNINFEGMPDFSRETVLSLVESYKKNINTMHPILVPSRLDVLIENFLKSTPESQAKPKQVSSLVAGFATSVSAGFVGSRNPESPGHKRKRSPGLGDHPEVHTPWDIKPGHPYRSISSALVLLVLALGAVSKHKGAIPDVVTEKEPDGSWSNSPTMRNGIPQSPIQSSPSLSTPMGMPSPQDTDRAQPRSRRTSIEGAYTTRLNGGTKAKNLDVIPGLCYFALATDIIGNQLGGNSLQHVHVNILAGLYHGQLARVMESHAYIHEACRGLQVILRPKLDRFTASKKQCTVVPAKDNPLVIAFWTCLQLESDIVAELPCPHSGILTYEEDMPSPNLGVMQQDGFDPIVVESYSAQLFLRKHLNLLHNMFYKPETDSQFPSVYAGKEPKHFPTIEACQESLNNIPGFAPTMAWKENDPPATDILGARLRAKYYGAQVITYRHFVLRILDINYASKAQSKDNQKKPWAGEMSNEFKSGVPVPAANEDHIDKKALEYSEFCIKALIQSTKAFHGLGDPGKDRLIVTNIWGTAHAQWGNMLTLQAAYADPILCKFVNEAELKDLLEKTMSMLKLVAQRSSALWKDYLILNHTGRNLGLLGPGPGPSANVSFSSGTPADTVMGGR
ncbi:hypothetical protein HYFRA_00006490 [Hymenoscyphus fraxineus]|uniref:Zn(2)-C6 fungal-type domain-containing protein n=1 Tax=Hymenoscyphus fraxineus TaxID=746836 RepID=A0A9N9KS85_9HELO|nr:hypothetical protein HYFRA_00006490 [Hymenoscyphus fraxineus]